jgi:glycine/D-amino acid oxidase-like deaminating enzyme
MATETQSDAADVVIVGAGVAGLLAAWQLARSGAKVRP